MNEKSSAIEPCWTIQKKLDALTILTKILEKKSIQSSVELEARGFNSLTESSTKTTQLHFNCQWLGKKI